MALAPRRARMSVADLSDRRTRGMGSDVGRRKVGSDTVGRRSIVTGKSRGETGERAGAGAVGKGEEERE